MISIIVTGSKGKMGQRIIGLIKKDSQLKLAAEVDAGDSLEKVIGTCDVIIDFSAPQATINFAGIAAKHGKPVVIGTTGFSETELGTIKAASKKTAVLLSPNMSLGVNLFWNLIERAGQTLDSNYKIKISETHHIHKKDKPSGTAKMMLQVVKNTECGKAQDIEIESIREGEVVGDHTIDFTSKLETLELTHKAFDRDVFAQGAIVAAKWLCGKKPGLYDMKDVLELNR